MSRNLVAAVLIAVALNSLRAQEAEASQEMDAESPYDNVQVLARAMQLIRQDYVDDDKTSYRNLTYSALRGMLAELDPSSQPVHGAEGFSRECRRTPGASLAGSVWLSRWMTGL